MEHGQGQKGGDGLGDHRSRGGAGDAPLERHHKQQIHQDIQYAGEDQDLQRRPGIPDGPKDGAADVVAEQEDGAQKVDAEIGACRTHGLLRRADGPQHEGNEGNGQETDESAYHDGGQHRRLHGLVELVPVAAAEMGADDDTRADGDAVEEIDQRIADEGGAADGGQCGFSHEVAKDDTVHRVVELLEQIPQQKRHREKRQVLPDASVGHVGALAQAGHEACLLSLWMSAVSAAVKAQNAGTVMPTVPAVCARIIWGTLAAGGLCPPRPAAG